ncbi:MAG: 50S ribosomal protein L7/L12 [Cytophagales bacterium]|nr:50S ribosomal protein L7/L12 [Cytophagales bacterium]
MANKVADKATDKGVDVKRFAEQLVGLTVKEVNELAKILKEDHGIEPAAAAVSVAAPSQGTGGETQEKSSFDLELVAVGAAGKLPVVRLVKEILGVGLKDAKDLVDAMPKVLKEGLSKAEAEEFKKKLEEEGAEVVLK